MNDAMTFASNYCKISPATQLRINQYFNQIKKKWSMKWELTMLSRVFPANHRNVVIRSRNDETISSAITNSIRYKENTYDLAFEYSCVGFRWKEWDYVLRSIEININVAILYRYQGITYDFSALQLWQHPQSHNQYQ